MNKSAHLKIIELLLAIIIISSSNSLFAEPTQAKINFFQIKSGQENRDYAKYYYLSDKATSEFIPFSKAILHKNKFLILYTPKIDNELTFRYAAFSPIPVKAGWKYKLHAKVACQYYVKLSFTAFFCKSGVPRNTFKIGSRQGEMAVYENEFAIPPDCDSMILSIGIHATKNSLKPGIKAIFQELSIEETSQIKGNSTLAGKNLLPFFNFENMKTGKFAPESNVFHPGNGDKPNIKWPNVNAEIVNINGVTCLKLTRTDKNYPYPFFRTKPYELQNCFVKFTATVKGEGKISLGLWWMRKFLSWDYFHREAYNLTDTWTEISVIRPCLSLLVKSAGCSFTSYEKGELYIKNMKLEVITLDK